MNELDGIDLSSGNLYKWMAILGVTLVGFCIFSTANVAARHQDEWREIVSEDLSNPGVDPETKEALLHYLNHSEKNLNSIAKYAMSGTAFGFILTVLGGGLWYWKIQRVVDKKIRGQTLSFTSLELILFALILLLPFIALFSLLLR